MNNVENENRIVYVDPNNIRGEVQGVPLTPDYTDFCIWCNLIVERSSRLKNQAGGQDENNVYAIAFDMTKAANGTEFVSFMQGKDAEAYNFLTTDYTNIDFDEIKKRNIVEGLQIESVNVAFVNYQTPQVTIKFVDIRGGGFFGREEATHNEYGHLSNLEANENNKVFDNFFSCFVSFPYPRFKLQIKGFYGKPVTFQLTCTNFNGTFNSTTGNFEITVQFIGYEYGILGDIPFDLLVAAPMTEIGKKYWDKQVADMANNCWALDGIGSNATEPPCLLFDFYQKISSALEGNSADEIDNEIMDDATEQTLNSITEQIKYLVDLKATIDNFKELIKKTFNPYYITDCVNDDENVMIIYNPNEIYIASQKIEEICDAYNQLGSMVDEYNSLYKRYNGGVSTSLIPNSPKLGKWKEWSPANLTFTSFIKHNCKGKDIKNRANHVNVINGKVLESKKYDTCIGASVGKLSLAINPETQETDYPDTYTISEGVSKQIYEDLSTRNWAIYGGDLGTGIAFAEYALAIDFGNTQKEIGDKLTLLQATYDSYTDKINNFNHKSIRDIVGFSPFVGRYFKVVMCHLETLVYLFNNCADIIEGQLKDNEREPGKLGIHNLSIETDVPSDVYKQVPPFPAVYKKYMTTEENTEILNSGKSIVANAWIGDFKGKTKWAEEELVNQLYKAAQRIAESRKKMSETDTHTTASVQEIAGEVGLMPIDYFYGIPNYAYSTIDGAMFYAALRAEVALNFMQGGQETSEKEAEQLGMYDGIMYAKNIKANTFLREFGGIQNLSNEMFKSTVYGNDFKSKERLKYEFVKAYNDRHPVFIQNGKKVQYKYMTNEAVNSELIPLDNFNTFTKINGFSNNYSYTTGKDFKPQDNKSDKFLIGCTKDTTPDDFYTPYTETHHFDVIVDSTRVDEFKEKYSKFKNEKVEINGVKIEASFDTIDNHLLVDDNRIGDVFNDIPTNTYKNYKAFGIDVNEFTDEKMEVFNKTGKRPSELQTLSTEIINKFLKVKF